MAHFVGQYGDQFGFGTEGIEQSLGHQNDPAGQGTGVGCRVRQKKDPIIERLFGKNRQLPDDFLQVLPGGRFAVFGCSITSGNGIAEFFFIQAVDGNDPRKSPIERLQRPAEHLVGTAQRRFERRLHLFMGQLQNQGATDAEQNQQHQDTRRFSHR